MGAGDWLGTQRAAAAADRILDAAGDLFAHQDVAAVGMNDIARAAGCSRATLYRYFENRDTLYLAYVHREANCLHRQLAECVAGVDDPTERLLTGLTNALQLVRESPALSAWFSSPGAPIGAQFAEQSDVIQTLTAGFLQSLGPQEHGDVSRRARWLVRVLTSLLIFPGHDADDERAMLAEFTLPVVCPSSRTPQR